MSTREIAAQAGWSTRAVGDLLQVCGHKDVAALEEIDAWYARDANVTHEARNRPTQKGLGPIASGDQAPAVLVCGA
jgi:hypothetical protein